MYNPRSTTPRRPAGPPISWRGVLTMVVATALLPALLWAAANPTSAVALLALLGIATALVAR